MEIIFLLLQIITESLPISSSGHLLLLEKLLLKTHLLSHSVITSELNNIWNFPTLLLFSGYFFKQWTALLHVIFFNWKLFFKCMLYIIAADCITVGWYLFFLWYPPVFFSLAAGFLITALLLYSLRFCNEKTYSPLILRHALIIGCMQGIALLPGISRLALTYTTGRWLGISPFKTFLFSCSLQAPLLAAAFLKSFIKNPYFLSISSEKLIPFTLIVLSLIMSYRLLGAIEYSMKAHFLWKISFYLLFPFACALIL